ncbi:MAG: CsbD family protein [Gammaproteobacteria bacterium]|nr:CsbD family protein [Gammaproteobacteria bacterium]
MTNEDQVKGRATTAKGKIKEGAGKLVGNKDLEAEGKLDQVGGKVRSKYGDVKEDLSKK